MSVWGRFFRLWNQRRAAKTACNFLKKVTDLSKSWCFQVFFFSNFQSRYLGKPITHFLTNHIFSKNLQREFLGGGFKDSLFSSLFGEDSPIWTNIFQMGWFNHQLGLFGRKIIFHLFGQIPRRWSVFLFAPGRKRDNLERKQQSNLQSFASLRNFKNGGKKVISL